MKHALRWLGLGALLAYLFDPDRGRQRRESLRARLTQLSERAQTTVGQLRSEVEDMTSPVSTTAPAPAPPSPASAAPATATANSAT